MEARQLREIARLRQKSMRLSDELDRATGPPLRLTPEERRQLAEKARGMDPERLREISVLDPEVLAAVIDATDSVENE